MREGSGGGGGECKITHSHWAEKRLVTALYKYKGGGLFLDPTKILIYIYFKKTIAQRRLILFQAKMSTYE